MPNQLQQFQTWLLEKRFFRMARFAKDPKNEPAPEEALAELPDELAEQLIDAANQLPVADREESAILEGLGKAIARWKEQPEASQNSIVILADPVSSVSRILTNCLIKLRKQQDGELLSVNLLDWIERPADAKSIKQQIEQQLGFDEDSTSNHDYHQSQDKRAHTDISVPDESDSKGNEDTTEEDSSEQPKSKSKKSKQKELMVIPNLCWCFLRSASGLDGLDYVQDILPSNHGRFWVMGGGIVGWEYLKSTIKFHAYCGETFRIPPLSGDDLQNWLGPLVDQFDIYFLDTTLHKRFENIDDLLSLDISTDKPIAALSEITQEVSATIKSSVSELKEDLLDTDEDSQGYSPERQYFRRLADVSDGVGTVALQLFIKSLRYREVEIKNTKQSEDSSEGSKDKAASNNQQQVLIRKENAPEGITNDSSTVRTARKDSNRHQRLAADVNGVGTRIEQRMIATNPKLPTLPDLSQNDLYLLYSLMLHGDLTIGSLAESLGDAPNVVNNQVQLLRNEGVIEQQGNVLKVNPAYYPQLRRELDRNNFIIEVPH